MKLINNKVYLSWKEMLECGFSENTLKSAKLRGSKTWDFMDDPEDRRKILVGYDVLAENVVYKKMVDDRFGNVYDVVARQPILEMVVNDHEAVAFYKGYRIEGNVGNVANVGNVGGKYLPIELVNKYTRAASWLNMLRDLDKMHVKKVLKVSLAEFYETCGQLIAGEKENGKRAGYVGVDVLPGEFPGTYQRLMARVEEYKNGGYGCLINSRFGNMNGSKLGKMVVGNVGPDSYREGDVAQLEGGFGTELQEISPEKVEITNLNGQKSGNKRGAFTPEVFEKQIAVMRATGALGNNLNAAQVRKIVNSLFAKNGWETLSTRSYSRFIKKNMDVLMPGRQGARAFKSKVAMQVKRKAPEFPFVFWTLDGWTVELMYREYDKKRKIWAYNRLVVVVVLDAMNKYPIGYAIGERENVALIRAACRNAMMHGHELFGAPYQPLQVQSDNYQIKNLTPFYQAMTALRGEDKEKWFTPAAVGNSKAKVIEPYFKYLNENYCQAEAKNWSGFNVDAKKTKQVNREWLDLTKNQFPDRAGVEAQIHDIIRRERQMKVAEYKAKWELLPAKDKHVIGDMDYLMMFGEVLGERTSSIVGQGIIKQVGGVEHTYDSFEAGFRENLHINWTLIGDKSDLRKVLAVSPDEKLRFVLEEKRVLPMDLYATTEEDVDYRVRIQQYNKGKIEEITETYANDANVVHELLESMNLSMTEKDAKDLQLMFTHNGQQKEGLQDAKKLGAARKRLESGERKAEEQEELNWEAMQYALHAGNVDLGVYGG